MKGGRVRLQVHNTFCNFYGHHTNTITYFFDGILSNCFNPFKLFVRGSSRETLGIVTPKRRADGIFKCSLLSRGASSR